MVDNIRPPRPRTLGARPAAAYADAMLALTLGQAKTIAIVLVIALVVGAIASAWLMKTVMQKVAMLVIFGLLALLVWTQRTSLDDCADRVRAAGFSGDTTCTILRRDIQIKRPTRRLVTTKAPRSVDAELAVLTAAKAVSNTALRWLGPFLPTLERRVRAPRSARSRA